MFFIQLSACVDHAACGGVWLSGAARGMLLSQLNGNKNVSARM